MAQKRDRPKSVSTTILLALAAGIVGGGTVWLFMRSDAPTPLPGAIAETGRAETQPSVEHLPPAQAAVALGNLELRPAELAARDRARRRNAQSFRADA